MSIYKAIPLVMHDIGAIGKDRKNPQQGYSFRGIDDLYNAANEALIKHGVFTVPVVTDMKREERQTQKGGTLIYTILTVKYTFYASDGSLIEAVTIGEAMDSGDKSCNKAMSAAQKYAFLQVFAIPTEEPKDTENETHEVKPKKAIAEPPKQEAKKDEIPEFSTETRPLTFDELREKILATTALPHLKNIWVKYKADVDMLSGDEKKRLTAVKDAKKKELSGGS